MGIPQDTQVPGIALKGNQVIAAVTLPARLTEPTDSSILTIIIVNWNTRDLLAQCLGSVAATCSLHPSTGQVWVLDNASADGSARRRDTRYPEKRSAIDLSAGHFESSHFNFPNWQSGRARLELSSLGQARSVLSSCLFSGNARSS